MEKIENFVKAVNYLKDKEILLSYQNNIKTCYYFKDGLVTVKNDNSHYKITLEQFKELFSKIEFYIYIPCDDNINTEKDEQYYSWKSKGTN